MHLRRSKERDRNRIMAIARKFASTINLSDKKERLSDSIGTDKVLVACHEDDKALGFVYAYLKGSGHHLYKPGRSELLISALCVDPGHHRKGAGKALLSELVKSNNHHKITCAVDATNKAGMTLFQKLGFKIFGKTCSFMRDRENEVTASLDATMLKHMRPFEITSSEEMEQIVPNPYDTPSYELKAVAEVFLNDRKLDKDSKGKDVVKYFEEWFEHAFPRKFPSLVGKVDSERLRTFVERPSGLRLSSFVKKSGVRGWIDPEGSYLSISSDNVEHTSVAFRTIPWTIDVKNKLKDMKDKAKVSDTQSDFVAFNNEVEDSAYDMGYVKVSDTNLCFNANVSLNAFNAGLEIMKEFVDEGGSVIIELKTRGSYDYDSITINNRVDYGRAVRHFRNKLGFSISASNKRTASSVDLDLIKDYAVQVVDGFLGETQTTFILQQTTTGKNGWSTFDSSNFRSPLYDKYIILKNELMLKRDSSNGVRLMEVTIKTDVSEDVSYEPWLTGETEASLKRLQKKVKALDAGITDWFKKKPVKEIVVDKLNRDKSLQDLAAGGVMRGLNVKLQQGRDWVAKYLLGDVPENIARLIEGEVINEPVLSAKASNSRFFIDGFYVSPNVSKFNSSMWADFGFASLYGTSDEGVFGFYLKPYGSSLEDLEDRLKDKGICYERFKGWVTDESQEGSVKTAAEYINDIYNVDDIFDLVRNKVTAKPSGRAIISNVSKGENFIEDAIKEFDVKNETELDDVTETIANDFNMSVPEDLKQYNLKFSYEKDSTSFDLVVTWNIEDVDGTKASLKRLRKKAEALSEKSITKDMLKDKEAVLNYVEKNLELQKQINQLFKYPGEKDIEGELLEILSDYFKTFVDLDNDQWPADICRVFEDVAFKLYLDQHDRWKQQDLDALGGLKKKADAWWIGDNFGYNDEEGHFVPYTEDVPEFVSPQQELGSQHPLTGIEARPESADKVLAKETLPPMADNPVPGSSDFVVTKNPELVTTVGIPTSVPGIQESSEDHNVNEEGLAPKNLPELEGQQGDIFKANKGEYLVSNEIPVINDLMTDGVPQVVTATTDLERLQKKAEVLKGADLVDLTPRPVNDRSMAPKTMKDMEIVKPPEDRYLVSKDIPSVDVGVAPRSIVELERNQNEVTDFGGVEVLPTGAQNANDLVSQGPHMEDLLLPRAGGDFEPRDLDLMEPDPNEEPAPKGVGEMPDEDLKAEVVKDEGAISQEELREKAKKFQKGKDKGHGYHQQEQPVAMPDGGNDFTHHGSKDLRFGGSNTSMAFNKDTQL